MQNNSEPKYDNDLVNLGYLKKVLKDNDIDVDKIIKLLPKSYSSPPSPPYQKESLLTYQGKLFKCILDKNIGEFDWNDWQLIATDDTTINNFIEHTYSLDKIQIQEQLDNKIETHYQSNDPAIEWTTDIIKKCHVGDYWYRTSDNTQWRYNEVATNPISYGWSPVDVPMSVYDKIDSKKSIYTSKPNSYKKDDMWIIEDTIEDNDLPIGTSDNPIKRGDWVFASSNSDTYNKEHWIKKDENISLEYLQQHYYNTETLETKFEEIDANVDSKINLAKDEISLNVSQTYTTKEETQTIVRDYDEQIGTITDTITTHEESISNLSVETGRISASVSDTITTTTARTNDLQTQITNNDMAIRGELGNYASNSTVSELSNQVNNLMTSTSQTIQIIQALQNGEAKKVVTENNFVFDKNGLLIDESNAKAKNQLNSNGMLIQDKTSGTNTELLFAGYDSTTNQSIVRTENLTVRHYLNIGSHSRVEDYAPSGKTAGTGIFYIS